MNIDEKEISYEIYGPTFWQVIHIIGKTYIYTSKESLNAVNIFFNSLFMLLPNQEDKYFVFQFIKMHPISNYFKQTGFQSFYWTYLLHDYINVIKYGPTKSVSLSDKVLTLQQANQLYRTDKEENVITKSFWGNSFWFMIHFLALIVVKNSSKRKLLLELIFTLTILMPCNTCKKHLKITLDKYNEKGIFQEIMNGGVNIFEWTVDLHNIVNKSLDKKQFTYQEAIRLYVISK